MLHDILSTEVFVCAGTERAEADHLFKQMEVSELALKRFLDQEISFSDYCEILELCGVDIDDFLITLEENIEDLCPGLTTL
jgi:hypothetical protein